MGLGIKFSVGDKPVLGEPRPHRFTIERVEQINTSVVALIRYTDATEYGGLKLLVYRDTMVNQVRASIVLDPHFLENSPSLTPFARFEPTEAGLAAAFAVAEAL